MTEQMTGSEGADRSMPAGAPKAERWRLLALLGVAQLMLILDVTVVAIALPQMAEDLDLGRSSLTWVVSAYTLTFGGLLLLGGRLADIFGSRAIVLIALAIFTAASMITGISQGPESLIAGRVGQGLGAALLSPAALSLVVRLFDGEERNRALGIWSSLGGAGAALGVLLGGALTAGPGWPWVFYVNVPIGVVILVALARSLEHDRPVRTQTRLDVLGAILVTAGTASATYGLVNAGDVGWLDRSTLASVAAALVAYLSFAAHQRSSTSPLIDPKLLARRSVAAGTLLIMVATALMISVFFLGTFSLQSLRGHGALATGLMFLPVALGTMAGATAAGRLVGIRGPGAVSATGLLVAAAGASLPVALGDTWVTVLAMSIAALGLGAVFVGASATTLSQAAHHESGVVSGILSTFHEFGAALGVAATSSIAAASIGRASVSGIPRGFAFAAVVAVVAAVIVLAVARTSAPDTEGMMAP